MKRKKRKNCGVRETRKFNAGCQMRPAKIVGDALSSVTRKGHEIERLNVVPRYDDYGDHGDHK